MAPLSLLGTVIRDKMMKTVTVQVNARSDMHNF
jgi:ribosomal protein S17